MSIIDAIKNSVLEGFDTSVTTTDILLGLLTSLLAGLFILLIYKNARKDVTPSSGFCLTLLMITAISGMIVLTITSNLALSLGMVGALSIVRFRTAIKDAVDTAFLFWAVAVGITAGAGFYLITLIGCLFIGALCIISLMLLDKAAKSFLLVVRMEETDVTNGVETILKRENMHFKHFSFGIAQPVSYFTRRLKILTEKHGSKA
jgi:hypothetical protein